MYLTFYAGGFGQSGSGGPTYTFSSVNIGTAYAARVVYAAIFVRRTAGATVQSVTIGGISATQCAGILSPGNAFYTCIWSATVPTGTAADIVVTTPGSGGQYCNVSAYSVTGSQSFVTATAVNRPISETIAKTDGGFLIGVGSGSNAGPSATWTGITEHLDRNTSTQNDTFSTAYIAVTSTGTAVVTYATKGVSYLDSITLVSISPTSATIRRQQRSQQIIS